MHQAHGQGPWAVDGLGREQELSGMGRADDFNELAGQLKRHHQPQARQWHAKTPSRRPGADHSAGPIHSPGQGIAVHHNGGMT